MNGIISSVQRFSTKDGPGIRTTVFLKGCNLECFWCHNPECISSKIEIQFFSNKCIGCMECIKACSQNALLLVDNNLYIDREKCNSCGGCTKLCPAKALILSGSNITAEELIKIIEKDKEYYFSSGGGVTFSGGEPMLQKDFLKEVLNKCKERNIYAAIETAANVPWSSLEEIYKLTDLFIIDIKVIDKTIHKNITGKDNNLILSNIQRLSNLGKKIWIRTPVIPEINDNIEAIKAIAEFINKVNKITKAELIPFHKLGINKYESLGKVYKASELKPISSETMSKLNDEFNNLLRKSG